MSLRKTIKDSHCLPDNEKDQALAAIHSQTITSEEHLKILLRFLHKNFIITSILPISEFILYVYIETIEETHGTRSSRPTTRRTVSLLRGNQEYFWSLLDIALSRDTWHHVDVCRFVNEGLLPFEEHIDTSLIHDQTENGDCF